ncbi:hypothetical protein PENANT_c005G03519 [Penicillium antarcticum]|uniref:Uncharacterized protein n=1 Tax=Penicillium antarcticum TaxID=416450 RepID=A0A1V6QFJ4_9EURO|nr:uncharacterized protein N7508_007962 [Penicillium antarcticum]KAJ5297713.1 hypothetical protein N7508_007962 [Penicillium antarcticum]OQD87646.1 hypothetical protein PENANT_c005G03519 [Penicillium antarcticum]
MHLAEERVSLSFLDERALGLERLKWVYDENPWTSQLGGMSKMSPATLDALNILLSPILLPGDVQPIREAIDQGSIDRAALQDAADFIRGREIYEQAYNTAPEALNHGIYGCMLQRFMVTRCPIECPDQAGDKGMNLPAQHVESGSPEVDISESLTTNDCSEDDCSERTAEDEEAEVVAMLDREKDECFFIW